jgi:hypothetical protein
MCAIDPHNAVDVFAQLAALRDVADSSAVRAVIENHDACLNAEAAETLSAFQSHAVHRLIADHPQRSNIVRQQQQLAAVVTRLPAKFSIAV